MAEKKEALENLGLKVSINVDVIVNAITQGTIAQAILEIAGNRRCFLDRCGCTGYQPNPGIAVGECFLHGAALCYDECSHYP